MSTTNPFFERPILNSPYEYPTRHWELDASGQPTQRIIEKRRRAEFITPIPKPRKRKGAAEQQQFVFNEGKGLSTKEQQYDPNSIINQLRQDVDQWRSLKEAHVEVDVASMKPGAIKGKHGYEVAVNKTLDAINPEEYALLVLPGGKAPEEVRKNTKAIEIARSFFKHHKPVAAICHGPQTLISAGLLKGRHATCYRSVAEELKEAGALYEDREVVIDGNLVTSREPSDLPAFMRETMKQLRL